MSKLNTRYYVLIFLLIFLFLCKTQAQDREALIIIDDDSASLLQKAKIYKKQSLEYRKKREYNSALYVAKKSLKHYYTFFRQTEDVNKPAYVTNVATMQREVAINYYYLGEYADAIFYYDRTINNIVEYLDRITEKQLTNARKTLARAYNGKAVILSYQSAYAGALQAFIKAAKIYEANNNLTGAAKIYNNVGILQKEQNNLDIALEYYKKSLKIYEELENEKRKAAVLSNIGILYIKTNQHGKALKYLTKAKKLNEKHDNTSALGRTIQSIGELNFSLGKYNEAEELYEKALAIKQISNNKESICKTHLSLAKVSYELKNYKKATDQAKLALQYANDLGLLKTKVETYELLFLIHLQTGKHQQALRYHQQFKTFSDTLHDKDKQLITSKLQVKYDLSKKEQQIQLLNKEKSLRLAELQKNKEKNKRQELFIWFTSGLLFFALAFAFVVYRRFKINKKQKSIIQRHEISMKEKNDYLKTAFDEIRQQKEDLQKQRDSIENQKNKTFNLFNDLKSSITYAKYIQSALLPSQQIFKQVFSHFFVLNIPHSIVSGDFYWVKQVNKWKILAVADCTGHGVPGALMSMLGITYLNEIVKYEKVKNVSQVLDILRQYIIDALKNKEDESNKRDGMDISIVAYDTEMNKLFFSGANGNLYLIRKGDRPLICNGEICEPSQIIENQYLYVFKGDRQPIGYEEEMKNFSQVSIKTEKEDQLYLFSDGYADQFGGPDNKKLKYKRFKEILLRNAAMPYIEQRAVLEHYFQQWKGSNRQVDDVLITGVKL